MTHTDATPDDEALIARIVNGDVNVFETLIGRYDRYVLGILRKHLPPGQVEEMSQDVFIRIFRSLSAYRPRGGFKKWLSTIAVRACYDFWRKKYRSREVPMSALSEDQERWLNHAVSDQSAEIFRDTASRTEAAEILEWVLSRLSAEDRMVIELVYLEDMSVREAAEILGWSVANVKVRAFRIRRKLKTMLETRNA